MIRQELNPVTCKLDTTVEKCRYAWLIRPCITRETRASSLVVDSGPCYHPLHYLKKGEEGRKRRKFYIYPDVTHTHPAFGRVVSWHMRWKWGWKGGMRMRWKWKWDERLLNRDPRRGTQKKREGANTHQHTWPGAGKPWKQGKRKAEADGHGTRPAEGGEDGSAWTNLTQRKPTPTSARAGPDLPGEGRTHEIGDRMGN